MIGTKENSKIHQRRGLSIWIRLVLFWMGLVGIVYIVYMMMRSSEPNQKLNLVHRNTVLSIRSAQDKKNNLRKFEAVSTVAVQNEIASNSSVANIESLIEIAKGEEVPELQQQVDLLNQEVETEEEQQEETASEEIDSVTKDIPSMNKS